MTDEKLQVLLSRAMLAGVLAAAFVLIIGLMWYLTAHPGQRAGDHIFSGEPIYLRSPVALVERALDFQAAGHRESLIQIGVLLLLLNPVLRVILATIGYIGQRDWLYSGASLVVLLVLLLSFFL